jgi:ribosomal protein S8E
MDSDYYFYLLYKDREDSPAAAKDYSKSKQQGKFEHLYRRKRKQELGSPGRFWAPTSAGVHLNASFVRGSAAWRVKHGE